MHHERDVMIDGSSMQALQELVRASGRGGARTSASQASAFASVPALEETVVQSEKRGLRRKGHGVYRHLPEHEEFERQVRHEAAGEPARGVEVGVHQARYGEQSASLDDLCATPRSLVDGSPVGNDILDLADPAVSHRQ